MNNEQKKTANPAASLEPKPQGELIVNVDGEVDQVLHGVGNASNVPADAAGEVMARQLAIAGEGISVKAVIPEKAKVGLLQLNALNLDFSKGNPFAPPQNVAEVKKDSLAASVSVVTQKRGPGVLQASASSPPNSASPSSAAQQPIEVAQVPRRPSFG